MSNFVDSMYIYSRNVAVSNTYCPVSISVE